MSHDTLIVGYLKPHKSFMRAPEVSQISRFSGETFSKFENINAQDLPTQRSAIRACANSLDVYYIMRVLQFWSAHLFVLPLIETLAVPTSFQTKLLRQVCFYPYISRQRQSTANYTDIAYSDARIFIYFIIYDSLPDMHGFRLLNWKHVLNQFCEKYICIN